MADAPNSGHNLTQLKKDILAAYNKVKQHKANRTAENEEIQAVRETLKAKGVHKDAFDIAMKYMNWDEDKRANFDFYHEIVREALGAPIQPTLFDAADEKERAEADTKPTNGLKKPGTKGGAAKK